MDAMNGPDLLDVLAAEDSPDVVHMILPNFATACTCVAFTLRSVRPIKRPP